MPTLRVRVGQYPLLLELCRAINELRQDKLWTVPIERNFPPALLNLIRNRGLRSNVYRYWGSLLLKDMLAVETGPEVKLVKRILGASADHKADEVMAEYENYLASQCEAIREYLAPLVRNYDIAEVVELKLYPLSTMPPPQIGRFGASLSKAMTTSVHLAFGAPPLQLWDDFNLNVSFFARGGIHYLVKEWLLAHEGEYGAVKEGLKPYLINLVSAIILIEVDHFFSTNIDLVFHEEDKLVYQWALGQYDGKMGFGNHLIEYVRSLNAHWPPPHLEEARRDIPMTVVHTIQKKVRVYIQDQYNLLANTRWIADYYDIAGSEDEGELELAYPFLVLPWDAEGAAEICSRHHIQRSYHEAAVTYEHMTGQKQFDTTDTLCLLIDHDVETSWKFVLLCPSVRTEPGYYIETSVLSQIHTPIAFVDFASGRRIL
ncbi:hypothetical protein QUF95_20765 [Paenibacillus silvae]|uniref:hypothetical protein n=1 Tax=Paenibacillus silvae TaxID=1325358 RepID=UPI0025A14C21|nr:hypothetical protein [Paenibacillus silvae]MDM5279839.1 hypothetical protein [Paenibacillus silvae]